MTVGVESQPTASSDWEKHQTNVEPRQSGPVTGNRLQGVIWLTIQAITVKFLQVASLVPLTWLVAPEDFGLFGLVTAIISLAGLIQQTGIREILIQRQSCFANWVTAAFWMSTTLGVLGGLLIAAFAPFAVRIWDNRQLQGLLLVLALTVPLQALTIVPEARLFTLLRFRTIAWIGIILAFIQAGLAVAMAWFGMGAYSFVLSLTLVTAFRAMALWVATRPTIRPAPEFHRWRLMFTDSSVVFLTNLSYIIVSQGDYLVLGMMVADEDVGHYFLAFNLAMAPLHLFAVNVNSVLFPSLSSFHNDPNRQVAMCRKVSRMLAIVVTPLSLLQAILAEPLVRLIFEPSWYAVIPLVQVLSLGMALRCVGWPSASLLQAQGRFVARLSLAAAWAVILLAAVAIGAWLGRVFSAAVAVSLVYTVVGPVTLYVALKPNGVTMKELLFICARPVLAGVAVACPAWVVSRAIANHSPSLQLLTILLTAVGLYVPAIRFADPQAAKELLGRVFPWFHTRFLHSVS